MSRSGDRKCWAAGCTASTRATELVADGWSEHKVCKWLGHTEAIAKKRYWQVIDDDFAEAARSGAAKCAGAER